MSAPRLPAEWEPQSGIMLTWPHETRVEPVFVHITCEISQREEVLIVCRDEALRQHVLHDDSWARDHGPITVLDENSTAQLLDFIFNGWGGKYPAERDNAITGSLIRQGIFGATPCRHIDFVLEGGSIDSDGQGRLLTTEACLLSRGRNPQLDKAGIEQALRKYLGTEHVLWLKHGALAGDDTDSHIDTLARFCDPHTITYASAELRALRDPDGQPYRLLPLPQPAAQFNAKGEHLPATYANFLIINGAVLVPTYDDPQDAVALERLQTGFPDHAIIAINARPLIEQFGSLHCVTMQLPAGVLAGSDYP